MKQLFGHDFDDETGVCLHCGLHVADVFAGLAIVSIGCIFAIAFFVWIFHS